MGGGYELFGRFCRPGSGADLPGAGPVRRLDACAAAPSSAASTARSPRPGPTGSSATWWCGGTAACWSASRTTAGATYLGPTAQPLGQVICGHGNSGDGHEGVALGSAIGTHLRGPCLPRNPALADFLIQAALRRRQPGASLAPLPDDLEHAARAAALRRPAGRPRRGRGLAAAAIGAAAVAGTVLGRPARAPPAGPGATPSSPGSASLRAGMLAVPTGRRP